MKLKSSRYRIYFIGFLISILVVFLYLRPLNSPWHKFIIGDGLGYYVYLPATYIYQDDHYEFKWFNSAFEKNYINYDGSAPDEQFLVSYHNKRINKYYPGMSLIWLPFFGLSHFAAVFLHYPADGFSLPYQWGIALASLCYLFLGLFYLKKLVFIFVKDEFIAFFVPVILFYGSFLFHYALNLNSLSHVYSFTLITLFVYFTHCFFNDDQTKLWSLALALFFLMLIVFIRPLNVLILLVVPAFVPNGFFKTKRIYEKPGLKFLALFLLSSWVIARQFSIIYKQSATFFPNTYVNEPFYFLHPKLWQVTFSYQAGFFVYVPIAFVALFAVPFLGTKRQKCLFVVLLALIIYLYSAWWCWSITNRALIDYYFIPALLLAVLLKTTDTKRALKRSIIFLLVLLMCYHQLKSMQFRKGILDENYTHKELFWKNFFRIHQTNIYAIPPETILKQNQLLENFEDTIYKGFKSDEMSHTGKYSLCLNDNNEYSAEFKLSIPGYFYEKGAKKIRFSFYSYFTGELNQFQIYFNFYNAQNQMVLSKPFYLDKASIRYGIWDEKAFGCELSAAEVNDLKPSYLSVFIWNTERKNKMFVDDVKTEVLLCDKSYDVN